MLAGEGLELSIAGVGERRLTVGGDPLAFPADATTQARLIGGPITDLNVMTRRQRCRHRVARRSLEMSMSVDLSSDWTLLVPMEECGFDDGAVRSGMLRGDVAIGERSPVPVQVLTRSPQLVFIVSIDGVA